MAPPSWARIRGAAERLARSELLREFAHFSAATVVWQGSRFAVNMAAAKVLGPGQFGLWNALNLIILYGPCLQLGVLSAMNRDVPALAARGLADRVGAIHRNTFSFVAIVYGIAAFGPGIAGLLFAVPPALKLPLALMGPALFVYMLYTYFLMYLRSAIRFDLLSRQLLLYALVLPVATLPLTLRFGLPGFVSGQFLAGLLMCAFLLRIRGIRPVVRLDWGVIRGLIGTGLPIMAIGLLYEVFSTLDRWVILSYLDQEQLGYYSLGIMIAGMVRLLPQVVSQQIYPRMSRRYGETGDPAALRPLVLRQTALTLGLMTAAAAACSLILPGLVRSYYPEYAQGIPAMLILVWGCLAAVPGGGLENLLTVIGRQRTTLTLYAVAVPFALLLMVVSARMGFGIRGVAWGFVLGNLACSCALVALGWRLLQPRAAVAG